MVESLKKKPILSFVRRQSRFSVAQRQALQDYWSEFGLSSRQGLLDFKQIFPRQSKMILEIGFGMGQSLFEIAQAAPDTGFIGIEVHRPGVGALLNCLHQAATLNVKIFAEDAKVVLAHSIAEQSLNAIYIFFPDPWPKKRHHKRRLIQADFVKLLCEKLKPGGKLQLATDWENYAEQMLLILSNEAKLHNASETGGFVARPNRPLTKFESRGLQQGRLVWDLVFIRKNAEQINSQKMPDEANVKAKT